MGLAATSRTCICGRRQYAALKSCTVLVVIGCASCNPARKQARPRYVHSRDAMTTTFNNMSIRGTAILTKPCQPVLSPLWEADLRQELASCLFLSRSTSPGYHQPNSPPVACTVPLYVVLSCSSSVTALGHLARKPVQKWQASTAQCSNPLDEGS
jgi:hypothetical protein